MESILHDKPDIALIDVNMPSLNGLEATKIIRETNPDLPIIGITTADHVNDIIECRKSGLDDVLCKPIDHDRLLACISKWRIRLKNREDVVNNCVESLKGADSIIKSTCSTSTQRTSTDAERLPLVQKTSTQPEDKRETESRPEKIDVTRNYCQFQIRADFL